MSAATKASDMRGMEDDELRTKLREFKEELFNLRFQAATGQLDNNRRLNVVRRAIARTYTVMRERELGITTIESEGAE
jgi:large subunit ribosomal protein L29